MARLTVFLDDGGVMNDNAVRVLEWQRLLGEFFAPRLGGTKEQWAAANRATAELALRKAGALSASISHGSWVDYYLSIWMRDMAAHAGIPIPGEDDEVLLLAREASAYVTLNCRSAFPEAAGAIRAISAAGFDLNTASGEESAELHGYLTGMGVRDCFGHLVGPDLIDCFKNSPAYYERAFALSGLDPGRCVVVDDSVEALQWAAASGAIAILMRRQPGSRLDHGGLIISNLAQLLPLLKKLDLDAP
jgi:FMN phosphatase YigB (HAD superfamily)